MNSRIIYPSSFVVGILLGLAGFPTAAAADAVEAVQGYVTSKQADGSKVHVRQLADSREYDLDVAEAIRPGVAKFGAATLVKFQVDNIVSPASMTALSETGVAVPAKERLIAMGGALLLALVLASIAARGSPLSFLIGLDNRYSNSQCQLVLWSAALAVIYVAAVALRIVYLGWDFVGGVGITANVVAMTGLSALSFGGAKVITAQKAGDAPMPTQKQADAADASAAVDLAGASAGTDVSVVKVDESGATVAASVLSVNPSVAEKAAAKKSVVSPKTRSEQPDLLNDLFRNDRGGADFGDFQMILVTLAAVAIYVLSSFVFLGALWRSESVILPDVDSSLLSAFGVGQGAYLLKKAAMKAGDG